MFHDAEEELKRLESELLAEDADKTIEWDPAELDADQRELDEELSRELEAEWDDGSFAREFESLRENPGQPNYRAYNADRADEDPEALSRAIQEPGWDNRGLIIANCVLMGGIVLVVLWWLFRYLL